MSEIPDLERLHSALTSIHHSVIYRAADSCPATLLEALKREFPHLPADSWPERFAWGGIYVNGYEMREDCDLTPPVRVEYYEPKRELNEAHTAYSSFSQKMIVFEDDDLIASFKPPRLPCTPAREQRQHSLKRAIEEYLGKEVHAPSRLDAAAQGLVIMSKSKRMHKHLQQAFEKHQVEKYYLVEVSPPVTWSRQLIENQIGRDTRHPILRAVVASGGDPAVSHFKVLYQVPENPLGPTTVLLAKPRTGRTHQLRVHTSHLGSPIVGDNFYGGIADSELHLCSLRFRFHNTLTKQMQEIQLPPQWLPSWVRPEAVTRAPDDK